MEENDENKLDKHSQDHYDKGIAKLLEEKQLKIKWKKEIEENESIQNYFKGYNPDGIDTFVNMYLAEKYLAHNHADFYEKQIEKKRTKWIDLANEHLECILQKKLFDLQCLWRAEQIKIDEILICFDFEVWEKDIFNCPFLEPINNDDINLYQDFLNSGQADRNSYYEWQDYDSLKEEYISGGDDCTIPEWYEYHNLRTGNSSLFLLPNNRGEKEEFYTDLVNAKSREECDKKKHLENPISFDKKPYLSYGDNQVLEFFSKTFENPEDNKKFKNYQEYNERNTSGDSTDELLWAMADIDEYISIESHYDYKQALEIAYNKYFLGKISEHLQIAHQQYVFNRNMSLMIKKKDDEDNFHLTLRNDYHQKILKGREINGEPRDFDF